MAIRLIARIRPLQLHERSEDVIVSTASTNGLIEQPTLIKIPNPKNEGEAFTFQFSSVYDHATTQQQVFEREVSPTVKHLFNGFDVTIFAYGSTGTGKTHTMRGGKTLAERGIIPRLLSGIYRRARKIDKESAGKTIVGISLSYYEIYNDKVFDLLEPPDRRTAAGLPLRDNGGKTVVVGLTERPCESLKDFEKMYDQANTNRSTSATKLNAASSRSHAILRIKLSISTEDKIRMSTASAIDLAGSEDNRRTENGKERMIESSNINKSLFTLAKCVEAIGRKELRIPYRESKMTRILSLGQNNGLTVMILNLAPVRSYHLDTLSSLNFANRTKKVECREIENETVLKDSQRTTVALTSSSLQRQPLRPLAMTAHNALPMHFQSATAKPADKHTKTFSVYSDRLRLPHMTNGPVHEELVSWRVPSTLKRTSSLLSSTVPPSKRRSLNRTMLANEPTISKEAIEDIIERKVADILAARTLDQPCIVPQPKISEEVQKRLELLEQKMEGKDDGREQGLKLLLMAKQHTARGQDSSALKMYTLAKDFFPENSKLREKIESLREKLQEKRLNKEALDTMDKLDYEESSRVEPKIFKVSRAEGIDYGCRIREADDDYNDKVEHDGGFESDKGFSYKVKDGKRPKKAKTEPAALKSVIERTPRTRQLLKIMNSRDGKQIRMLRGVGTKKAETIIHALCSSKENEVKFTAIQSLDQLSRLPGVGEKTVENMRNGLPGVLTGA